MENQKYNPGDKFEPKIGDKIKYVDDNGYFIGYIEEMNLGRFFVHHPYKNWDGPAGNKAPEHYSFRFNYLPIVTRAFEVIGSKSEDESSGEIITDKEEVVTDSEPLPVEDIEGWDVETIIRGGGVVIKKDTIYIPADFIKTGNLSLVELQDMINGLQSLSDKWGEVFGDKKPKKTYKPTRRRSPKNKHKSGTEEEKIVATAEVVLMIENILKEKRLTTREMASHVGLGQATLDRLIKGLGFASHRTAKAISSHYSLPYKSSWDKLEIGRGKVSQKLSPLTF